MTAGAVWHEARMTLRSKVLWWSLPPLAVLAFLLSLGPSTMDTADPVAWAASCAVLVNLVCALGIAVALADRLARQRRPGLTELFSALPAGTSGRLAAVVLGPWLVALVPPAAVLLVVAVWGSVLSGSAGPLRVALLGVITVVAPGTLMLTALACLLGLILPLAAARALIVPIWFWATVFDRRLVPLPTVSYTIFSPSGGYAAAAWLHGPSTLASPWSGSPPPDTGTALVSIAVTLSCAAIFFLLARMIFALR